MAIQMELDRYITVEQLFRNRFNVDSLSSRDRKVEF